MSGRPLRTSPLPAPSRPETSQAPRRIELAPLPDQVGYALRRAQIAVFRHFAKRFSDLDITPTQLGILTVVGNNPGCKQSEVGAALGIKRANIVPLIDGLAERNLVVRGQAFADRRSHALGLTSEGRALLAELRRREAEHERQVAARIGPGGRRQLLALLAGITEACAEAPGEGDEAGDDA